MHHGSRVFGGLFWVPTSADTFRAPLHCTFNPKSRRGHPWTPLPHWADRQTPLGTPQPRDAAHLTFITHCTAPRHPTAAHCTNAVQCTTLHQCSAVLHTASLQCSREKKGRKVGKKETFSAAFPFPFFLTGKKSSTKKGENRP